MLSKTLRQLCLQSLRLQELSDTQYAAFKKELGAIELNDLENYFLHIHTIGTKVSNKPNSLVAYLIGITNEFPAGIINYRGGTMPDIDSDFADNRRDEVLQYLIQQYGSAHVAGIGTLGYFWSRQSIVYAAKALGFTGEDGAKLSSLVPEMEQGKNWHIEEILSNTETKTKPFRDIYEKDPMAKRIIDAAKGLDGLISNRSQHASGYIVSNTPIAERSSVWYESKSKFPVTEYNGDEVSSLGFVKIDMLGLKTLTVMDEIVNLVNKRHSANLTMDTIPLDDPDTFKVFATGDLLGVFQVEASGIAGFAKAFGPESIEDIALILAGYRPGPMKFLPDILSIRAGEGWKEYQPAGEKFPILEPILRSTCGMFLYQEQIQKVVELLAGYSDHEADEFRKTISKKLREKMVKEKTRFSAKALEKGMSSADINELWDQMESFSSYSFNFSHALAYAVLTIKTAYLKKHYPVEFYAINILHELDSQEKVSLLVGEARKYKIDILAPDINESQEDFAVTAGNEIRFGLSGIAGIGRGTGRDIITARDIGGKFKSITDFLARTATKSNVMENLIKAGCFSGMGTRSQLLHRESELGEPYHKRIADMIKFIESKELYYPFTSEVIPMLVDMEYETNVLADMEHKMLGVYITYNPLTSRKSDIDIYLAKYNKPDDSPQAKYKKAKPQPLIGLVKSISIFKSGKGAKMIAVNKDWQVYEIVLSGVLWVNIKPTVKDLSEQLVAVVAFKNDEGTYFARAIEVIPENHQLVSRVDLKVKLDYDFMSQIGRVKAIKAKCLGDNFKDLYLHMNPGRFEANLGYLPQL